MDGFISASNPGGGRVMGYYTQEDLPFYYFLASSFAISDRNFGSVLGPTQTNRLFLWLGTSCDLAEGFVTNPAVITECGLERRSLFDQLDHAKKSYGIYDQSGLMTLIVGLGVKPTIPKTIEQFALDAANGKLPPVSFVGASTGEAIAPDGNDDHPPFNPQKGQAFVASIVRAIAHENTWNDTALIVTYDEHGGYYDHVRPPHACEPEPAAKRDYPFDQYGFRVPLIVVSPFANSTKRVSHVDTDHTSILRFIQLWANEPALTKRDANAWPLLDLFDFEQTPLPAPEWPDSMTDETPAAQGQCASEPDGATGVPDPSQNCTATP
jgi:phospholipase C